MTVNVELAPGEPAQVGGIGGVKQEQGAFPSFSRQFRDQAPLVVRELAAKAGLLRYLGVKWGSITAVGTLVVVIIIEALASRFIRARRSGRQGAEGTPKGGSTTQTVGKRARSKGDMQFRDIQQTAPPPAGEPEADGSTSSQSVGDGAQSNGKMTFKDISQGTSENK